jgi:3-oxoacyl-[acyl-carrier-protein] synthase II
VVGDLGARRKESGASPVSICGIGAVTGYGWGRKLLWDGLITGESAVVPTPGYSPYLEHDIAYVATIGEGGDPVDGASRHPRALRFAVREALEDAHERGWKPGPTVGLVHATVLGDTELWCDFHQTDPREVTKANWVQLMPSTTLSMLMREHGFHGPCMSVSSMCASGNAALITAKAWLDAGIVSDVVMVTADLSAIPINAKYFRDLGVLVVDRPSLDACRPFQEGSLGFTGGEAAAALVLSGRPDGSYATFRGGAMTHDGHHVISIAPDHHEIFRAFHEGLANAAVEPEEVAYLNAHGPGTTQCDAAEARVFDELLTEAKGLFSLKPLTGHCQAAAATVELIGSLYGYSSGVVIAPPQVAPGHPLLVDGTVPREPGVLVKSSIGMGGYNSVVVLDEPIA